MNLAIFGYDDTLSINKIIDDQVLDIGSECDATIGCSPHCESAHASIGSWSPGLSRRRCRDGS